MIIRIVIVFETVQTYHVLQKERHYKTKPNYHATTSFKLSTPHEFITKLNTERFNIKNNITIHMLKGSGLSKHMNFKINSIKWLRTSQADRNMFKYD